MHKISAIYIICYAILLGIVLTMLAVYPKGELHIMLNSCHTAVLDTFLKYYSVLAEWPLYVVALIPLAFRRWRWTLWYACSELCSAGVVQILKHIFRAPRPASFFEDYPDVVLPVVDGVRLHHSNSFPSGHTATFFVFFTFLTLMLISHLTKKGTAAWKTAGISILMLFMAALGGYSRIYLSQHFLSDVCVGSIIGVLVASAIFYFSGKAPLKYRNTLAENL